MGSFLNIAPAMTDITVATLEMTEALEASIRDNK